jgi:Domain of unknown function (DUF1707)
MAGLEHEMAGGDGRGRLRASHADRERVIDTLKAAHVYGLVTKDEFDERVAQTFAARTYAELAVITADIPAGLPAAPPLRPTSAKDTTPVLAPTKLSSGERAVVATALLAGLALIAALTAAHFAAGFAAGLLALAATGNALLSMILGAVQVLGSSRDKRSGGQLPPQRRIDSGASAAHRAISPTSPERFSHAAKPRRSRANAARHHSLRPQLSG